MIGHHFIKGWSRTQNNVTTSSAAAELVAMVKCSADLLGLSSFMMDLGRESRKTLKLGKQDADSVVALGHAPQLIPGLDGKVCLLELVHDDCGQHVVQ